MHVPFHMVEPRNIYHTLFFSSDISHPNDPVIYNTSSFHGRGGTFCKEISSRVSLPAPVPRFLRSTLFPAIFPRQGNLNRGGWRIRLYEKTWGQGGVMMMLGYKAVLVADDGDLADRRF
jgi:hypothetical protein